MSAPLAQDVRFSLEVWLLSSAANIFWAWPTSTQPNAPNLLDSATPRMSLPFCSRLNAADSSAGTLACSAGKYAMTLAAALLPLLMEPRARRVRPVANSHTGTAWPRHVQGVGEEAWTCTVLYSMSLTDPRLKKTHPPMAGALKGLRPFGCLQQRGLCGCPSIFQLSVGRYQCSINAEHHKHAPVRQLADQTGLTAPKPFRKGRCDLCDDHLANHLFGRQLRLKAQVSL